MKRGKRRRRGKKKKSRKSEEGELIFQMKMNVNLKQRPKYTQDN